MQNNSGNSESKDKDSNISNTSLDIDALDVVKLIMQFCKENNLYKSLLQLEDETKIKLNSVDNVEEFRNDIINGRWDKVLRAINGVDLEVDIVVEIYEQIVYELVENEEKNLAFLVLDNLAKDNFKIKQDFPQRFKRLMNIVECNVPINEIYAEDDTSKEKNRLTIAKKLTNNLTSLASNRLMMLLSSGLKYLISKKEIPSNLTKYDVLSGKIDRYFNKEENEVYSDYVKSLDKQIHLGDSSYFESAKFSPDGNYLATGSADGFIDIWDSNTGKLKSDLPYQMENASGVMVHDESVTSLIFSKDSKMLCSGDNAGNIKVFKISNGKCLREFPNAHSKGVTCLAFSKDSSIVISGSFDSSIHLMGLRAGKLIKELKGHTSFINDIQINWEAERFYSASSDGTVIYWDLKHQEIIRTFSPPVTQSIVDIPINNIMISYASSSTAEKNIFVSNRSNSIYLMSSDGEIIRTYCTERKKNIVYSALSNDESWLYAVDEDNCLYTFSVKEAIIRNFFKIHEKDVIAILHHPNFPNLASYALDGKLNIYK